MTATLKRHPEIPTSRVALGEDLWERQKQRGIYTMERGEAFSIPVDSLKTPEVFQHQVLWVRSEQFTPCPDHPDAEWVNGVCTPTPTNAPIVLEAMLNLVAPEYAGSIRAIVTDETRVFGDLNCQRQPISMGMSTHRPGTAFKVEQTSFNSRVLKRLREEVDSEIPYRFYQATLGHDLHISNYGNLFARHWHQGWADPFTGEHQDPLDPDFIVHPDGEFLSEMGLRGFVEDLGWRSGGLVTTAFRAFEIAELVAATEYQDCDFAEVGTNATAEVNSHVALQTTTGIARVGGTPTDADPIFRSVATITADASESFEEHGIFSNSTGATMMDRSTTGGQSVTSSDQVEYTYELTKVEES